MHHFSNSICITQHIFLCCTLVLSIISFALSVSFSYAMLMFSFCYAYSLNHTAFFFISNFNKNLFLFVSYDIKHVYPTLHVYPLLCIMANCEMLNIKIVTSIIKNTYDYYSSLCCFILFYTALCFTLNIIFKCVNHLLGVNVSITSGLLYKNTGT